MSYNSLLISYSLIISYDSILKFHTHFMMSHTIWLLLIDWNLKTEENAFGADAEIAGFGGPSIR